MGARLLLRVIAAWIAGVAAIALPAESRAQPAPRVALVIGNDNYKDAPLKNARNDARVMAASLTSLGFQVDLATDLDQRALEQAVERFVTRIPAGAIALAFYAGHGIQIDGDNYLLPIDFEARDETEARYRGYSATRLYDRIAGRGVRIEMLILDACRDNPFRQSRSAERGLRPMTPAQKGSLIAFSTAPGSVASDSPNGVNSVFTAQLVDALSQPGLNVDSLFLRVRSNVNRITNGRQTPWTNSSLLEEFFFTPSAAPVAESATSQDRESILWEMVNATDAPELLDFYLAQYPKGRYASVVQTKLAAIRERAPAGTGPSASSKSRPTVAVDAFENLTRRQDLDWVGTALSASLTAELALGEALRVPANLLSPTPTALTRQLSVAPRAGSNTRGTEPRAADFTVAGSYLVAASQGTRNIRVNTVVRRTGQPDPVGVLVDTAPEAELSQLVARQGDRIKRLLQVPAPSEESPGSIVLPASQEAKRLYAEALDKLTRRDAMGASEALIRLTTLEPNFALGYATLSAAWAALGFDGRAQETANRARELADGLPREQHLVVDAQYFQSRGEWDQAVAVWRALVGFFPDNVDYWLELAASQISTGQPKNAMETLTTLRQRVQSAAMDPRLLLVESMAARSVSDYPRAQALAAEAVKAGVTLGATQIAAAGRLEEAWALKRLGERDRAVAADDEARRLYSVSGDRAGIAAATIQLATDVRDQGNTARAADLFTEAIAIARAIGDRRRLGVAFTNLANLLLSQRRYEEARSFYQQALAIHREIQDKTAIATTLGNVASTLIEEGKPDEAAPFDAEALRLWREIGSPRSLAVSLVNTAETTADRAELQSAASLYQEARELLEKLADKRTFAYALRGLATTRMWQGSFDVARELAGQASQSARDARDSGGADESEVLLAFVDYLDGRCDAAADRATRLQEVVRDQKEMSVRAGAVRVAARACLGDLAGAELALPTDLGGVADRVVFEVEVARARLRATQGRRVDADASAQAARAIATRLRSRFLLLISDLVTAEVDAMNGGLKPDAVAKLQREAAAAGAVTIVQRLQALAQ